MIKGIFLGLFSAWTLTLFNFDSITINALDELFGITISSNIYYFTFATTFGIYGLISDIFRKIKYRPKNTDTTIIHDNPDDPDNNIISVEYSYTEN